MARPNYNLLFKKADDFWKLAQQIDDPNDEEDQEESPEEEEERLREELARAQERRRARERAQQRQQRQPNQRAQRGQPRGQNPQQQQPQAQEQAQAPQAQQGPEQIVSNGLVNEVYSSLKPVGSALRGVFTPEINTKVTGIITNHLFTTNLAGKFFGGTEDKIKKYVIEQKVRFDVRVVINPNMSVYAILDVTDQAFKSQYQQYFAKASQELGSSLQPTVYNVAQSALRENNLEPKMSKPVVVDSWFSVAANGALTPIA